MKPQIEKVLSGIAQENLTSDNPVRTPKADDSIKAAAWNIERGKRLSEIIRALKEHDDLAGSDVLLLTELDYGMARTGNEFVGAGSRPNWG